MTSGDVSFNSATTTDGQALIWDAANQIWTPGTVATTSSSSSSSTTTTSVMSVNAGDFKVLEKIAGVCDGRTISGETTAYALKNVLTYQDISTTLVDVEGSSIAYTPPNNAKQVLYNFRFNVVDISNEANVFNQNHTLTIHLTSMVLKSPIKKHKLVVTCIIMVITLIIRPLLM